MKLLVTPETPYWALDQHTLKGKAMGRGLDHFRKDSAKPPPTAPARTRLMPLAIKQRPIGGIGMAVKANCLVLARDKCEEIAAAGLEEDEGDGRRHEYLAAHRSCMWGFPFGRPPM
jgi:hypothetical protein